MALTERYAGFNVGSVLAHRATSDPERVLLHAGEDRLSVGEVESRANALAAALAQLGIEAGDRVALVLPAWPEFVVSLFAVAKLGGVIVPLNPRLTVPELRYMLRHSEAVAAVTAERLEGLDYLQIFEELMPALPELQYLVTVGDEDLWYDDRIFQFGDLLSAGTGRDFPTPTPEPATDVFAIVYTSGTTGKPKGVALTHANVVHVAAATADATALGEGDRVGGMTALFHVFGIGPGILGTLCAGASLVLQDDFDAGALLDRIERDAITVQFGIPTLFVTEIREQERRARDVSSLRLGVAAGAPVPAELVQQVERTLGHPLLVAYSLTETSSTVTITRPSDSAGTRRFTAGTPIADTEVRIVEEDGGDLPVESVGEIVVRGHGVMKGYYRQPRETSQALDDGGFFRTGDLGMRDEHGELHLVGRRKDVIIRAGFNVYPREVEDRIQAHPAIHEVAVVGAPDEVMGEAVCACIVPIEGAIVTGQEIEDWCRVTLADYKIPDRVRFLDEFPRTGTGKVRRVELARMMRTSQPRR